VRGWSERANDNANAAVVINAALNNKQIEESCRLDEAGRLAGTGDRPAGTFGARLSSRVLKVARTIADLAAEELIRPAYVAEAVQYRCLDLDRDGFCGAFLGDRPRFPRV
jgi:magnesium chelatase family protein